MKLFLLALCLLSMGCAGFNIKIGAYYQGQNGEQVGASVEIDPSYSKQKK